MKHLHGIYFVLENSVQTRRAELRKIHLQRRSGITPGIEVEFTVNMGRITEFADFKFKDRKLFDVFNLDPEHLAVGKVVDQCLYSGNIYVVWQKVHSTNLHVGTFIIQ